MCLDVYHKFPNIARTDIVCYKVLLSSDEWMNSPYQNFHWKYNKKYTANERFKICSKFKGREYLCNDKYEVEEGYFHTFKTQTEAEISFELWGSAFTRVYKCIIPAGSLYFSGKYGTFDGYASKKLIIKEMVRFK